MERDIPLRGRMKAIFTSTFRAHRPDQFHVTSFTPYRVEKVGRLQLKIPWTMSCIYTPGLYDEEQGWKYLGLFISPVGFWPPLCTRSPSSRVRHPAVDPRAGGCGLKNVVFRDRGPSVLGRRSGDVADSGIARGHPSIIWSTTPVYLMDAIAGIW